MKISTCSSFPGVPFNDTLESFFDAHTIGEDIECYQLLFCPYGTRTSFSDLNKLKFNSRTVILNIMDSMIDVNDNLAIEDITKFCSDHPEQNFIILSVHLGLNKQFNVPNLYLDSIVPTSYTEPLQRCEKKNLTNKWILLNSDTKVHKVMTVCYLLSKGYHTNGNITFDMNTPTLVKYDQYKNFTTIPNHLREDFSKGYAKFKSQDFDRLQIRNFDRDDDRVANNYNVNLLPSYEQVGLEIISGTMFFEKTPLLSEKEIQSVYAKNFPIYINGVGMAKEFKKFVGLDIFEDIIDHSYDEIENHFERLCAAIDKNQHLLNGSTNIKELWYDNQKRFEANCDLFDSLIHDQVVQHAFNYAKLKKALTHFDISVTDKV